MTPILQYWNRGRARNGWANLSWREALPDNGPSGIIPIVVIIFDETRISTSRLVWFTPWVFPASRSFAISAVCCLSFDHDKPILVLRGLEEALAAKMMFDLRTHSDDAPLAAEFFVAGGLLAVFDEAFDFFSGIGREGADDFID